MSTRFTGRGSPGDGELPLGPGTGVSSLYGQLYFASEAAFARLPAAELADAVLRADSSVPGTSLGPGPSRNGSFCAAQFVISTDPPERFDPDLSMREPLEIQVWPDGSFVVEIEFSGQDVRTDHEFGEGVAAALGPWASTRGWRLLNVFNDRGRSLPDVWNAAFLLLDTTCPVTEVLDFARRGISVAEAHRCGGRFVEHLLSLLRAGDAEGLAGTPVTAVFQPRAKVPADAVGDFQLALDVSAFANSALGGLVVFGLEDDGTQVIKVSGDQAGDETASRIRAVIERLIFPAAEGVQVEAVSSGAADGHVVFVLVPPQENMLKPFLVHGTITGDQISGIGVTMVERRHARIYTHGMAALHSQIAAGRALLGGGPA
jgi:hypothetical protein